MIYSTLLAFFTAIISGFTNYIGETTPPYNQAMAVIMFNATLPANQFVVPGDKFYRTVLHWNESQTADFELEAMTYFRTKFGLVNPKANSSLYTLLYSTNPDVNMRCVFLSGEGKMPRNGFAFLDGGWLITVVNPAGITLGGEFPGLHVPFRTTFSIGQYVIDRPNKSNIMWRFQHSAPGIVADQSKGLHISGSEMQIKSDRWGTGFALPVTKYTVNAQQTAQSVFRNVITF